MADKSTDSTKHSRWCTPSILYAVLLGLGFAWGIVRIIQKQKNAVSNLVFGTIIGVLFLFWIMHYCKQGKEGAAWAVTIFAVFGLVIIALIFGLLFLLVAGLFGVSLIDRSKSAAFTQQ